MDSAHLIEEIKAKIDIVDLVSEHVELKRAGQNLKGLCPFHTEKTPSFMVSPSKQIFHCFGCHKGGDIFAFLMNYEGLSFQEALTSLAHKAGVSIERYQKGPKVKKGLKESLFALHTEAVLFYKEQLNNSKQARAYLKERGLAAEVIESFSLGYSPGEKDALLRHLLEKGFSKDEVKASGLAFFNEKDSFDFFRGRVMFPILDLQGRVIAFGGRILAPASTLPKYINSPDSPLFKKRETNYALHQAKGTIIQKGYAIVVEGYFDAVICHQNKFDNAVAPLGTALTPEHVRKLKRFTTKILLLFDGDTAGTSATKRALELVYAEGMVAKVLPLPKGEDPDTFIRKSGAQAFRKSMARSLSPAEFFLRAGGRDKLTAVRQVLSMVAACPDSLIQDEILRELADRSKINETSLREELKHSLQKRFKGADKRGGQVKALPLDKREASFKEEQILLSIALSMPEKVGMILDPAALAGIEDPLIQGVFQKAGSLITKGDAGFSLEELMRCCTDEERVLITKHSFLTDIDPDELDKNIADCLKKIRVRGLDKRIKLAEDAQDATLLRALLSEKKKILSQGAL